MLSEFASVPFGGYSPAVTTTTTAAPGSLAGGTYIDEEVVRA